MKYLLIILVVFQLYDLGHANEEANLWVVSIGVSQYEDVQLGGQFADHDAQSLVHLLKTHPGLLFNTISSQVLVNEQATQEEILKAIEVYGNQASPEDLLLIYLAGKGWVDQDTGTYLFLPYDTNTDHPTENAVPMSSLLPRGPIKNLMLWIDTAHAGAARIAADETSFLSILAACRADQVAVEDKRFKLKEEDRGHGAFTFSLMKGLQGAAADSNGVVWLSTLVSHVSRDVPRLTRGKQSPHYQVRGKDIPLLGVPATAVEPPPLGQIR